jgi:hypothetical protein
MGWIELPQNVEKSQLTFDLKVPTFTGLAQLTARSTPTFTQPQGSCQLPFPAPSSFINSIVLLSRAVLETQVACMPTELDVLNH